MMVYILLFGIAVGGSILLLFAALSARRATQLVDDGPVALGRTMPTLEDVELSMPFFDRVIRPTLNKMLGLLGRLAPSRNIQETQHKLELAGRPNNWTPADFLGLRLLSALVCTAMAVPLLSLTEATMPARLLLAVAFGVLGAYLPVVWLGSRIRQRKRTLLRALPDGLDMLNICVGAGLGFDAALARVADRWPSLLADEFRRIVTETRLGKVRRQALLDFAARTELPDVESFVNAIVQADQLGVSIAKVLQTQAEQMRIVRRQRAEEQARQASIKMLFPLVFLIFPSLLAVLLGPAVPQILRAFTDLGQ